jgi:hypothetical protein
LAPQGSKNFESAFVLDLDAFRKRRRPRELKLPVVRHLKLAESFQGKLEAGDVATRAELARLYGLTRARVSQLMSLLLLHPDILDYVRQLPAGTPDRLITERKLRALVEQPRSAQLVAAMKHVAGFASWKAGMTSKSVHVTSGRAHDRSAPPRGDAD